jgi:lambda family phage tail tape measure protein
MASNQIGDLSVSLTANVDQFKENLNQAKAKVKDFADESHGSFGKIKDSLGKLGEEFNPVTTAMNAFKGALAALAAEQMVAFVKRGVEAQAELADLAFTLNTTADEVAKLSHIATMADLPMSAITATFSKLTKQLGAAEADGMSPAGKAFKALGIDIHDSNGKMKDTLVVQKEVAIKMNEYAEGVNKDLIAQALFGKSAVELKKYMKELADATEVTTNVTIESAARAQALDDEWKKMKIQAEELTTSLINKLTPALLDMTSGWNAAGLAGMTFWERINHKANIFQSDQEALDEHKKSLEKFTKEREELLKKQANLSPTAGAFVVDQMKEQLKLNAESIALEEKENKYYQIKLGLQTDINKKIEEGNKKKEEGSNSKGGKKDAPNINNAASNFTDKSSEIANSIIALSTAYAKLNDEEMSNVQKLDLEIALTDKYKTTSKEQIGILRTLAEAKDATDSSLKTKKENDAIDAMNDGLNKLLVADKALSNEQKARFDMESSKFKEADQSLKDQLIARAKLVDAVQQHAYAIDKLKGIEEQVNSTTSGLELQVKFRTLGNDALKKEQDILKINLEYMKLMNDPKLKDNEIERNKIIASRTQALEEVGKAYDKVQSQEDNWQVGAVSAVNKYAESLTHIATMTEKAFSNVFSSLQTSMEKFVKTGKFDFNSLVQVMIDELIRLQVASAMSPIFSLMGRAVSAWAFSGSGGGTGVGTSGAPVGGGDGTTTWTANGNAFGEGLIPYANGGEFTNSIVNTPTPFKFGNGSGFNLGVMGEAGPEAVMPLTRGADGKLGVQASGGGGGGTSNNFNVTIQMTSSKDPQADGAAAAQAFVQAIAQSEIAKSLRPGGQLNRMNALGR